MPKDVEDAAEEAAVFVASKEACCDDNGRLSGLDDAPIKNVMPVIFVCK